jgi:hypothetical protein
MKATYKINRYGCPKPVFHDMVIVYAMGVLRSSIMVKELEGALEALNKCIEDDIDQNLKQLREDLAVAINLARAGDKPNEYGYSKNMFDRMMGAQAIAF